MISDKLVGKSGAPTRGRDYMGLVAVSGKLYAVGGRLESFNNNSPLHHVYDLKTDKWAERDMLPAPRSGFAVALLDGLIVVIGGEGRKRVFNENEVYDPENNRWRRLALMPSPHHGTGAAVIGSMMYISGGGPVTGGSRRSDVLEVFTPKQSICSELVIRHAQVKTPSS
jgi:N-acetylneuraminic acid mutarotase